MKKQSLFSSISSFMILAFIPRLLFSKYFLSLVIFITISLGGYPPFSDNVKDMTMYQQVVTGSYTFPDEHWKHISTEGKTIFIAKYALLERVHQK